VALDVWFDIIIEDTFKAGKLSNSLTSILHIRLYGQRKGKLYPYNSYQLILNSFDISVTGLLVCMENWRNLCIF